MMRCHATKPRPRFGLTLLELLAVIAIIGILIAIAVPSLRAARNRALKTDELNNLRSVGLAWTLYANANNDSALPGYLEPDVQARWQVRYRFRYPADDDNGIIIPPAPDFNPASPNLAGPWPWRLLDRLQHSHRLILGYREDDIDTDASLTVKRSDVAYQPAFAYNGYYFGGWWYMTGSGANSRATYRFGNSVDATTDRRVGVVARKISQAARPSELVTFLSAAYVSPGLWTHRNLPNDHPGWHLAVPPFLEQDAYWQQSPVGLNALRETAIPIGRYTRQVAVLFADLNTSSTEPRSLADQRKWIGPATSRDWKHRELDGPTNP